MRKIKSLFYNFWYKRFPPETVKYWKSSQGIPAKVTVGDQGEYIMWMEGEKYPFPGFPRGRLLFGTLSPLKHWVKNWFFNDAWKMLEEGEDRKVVISKLKGEVLEKLIPLIENSKIDMLPPERMVPSIRELWRALTVIEGKLDARKAFKLRKVKEALCYVLQEDDGYRFRVQWLISFFNPRSWWRRLLRRFVRDFDLGWRMMEHAEVINDMKERIRLARRILMLILEDETIKWIFDELCREVDWNKIKLTKADRYFFRAKYFRCDYDRGYEY